MRGLRAGELPGSHSPGAQERSWAAPTPFSNPPPPAPAPAGRAAPRQRAYLAAAGRNRGVPAAPFLPRVLGAGGARGDGAGAGRRGAARLLGAADSGAGAAFRAGSLTAQRHPHAPPHAPPRRGGKEPHLWAAAATLTPTPTPTPGEKDARAGDGRAAPLHRRRPRRGGGASVVRRGQLRAPPRLWPPPAVWPRRSRVLFRRVTPRGALPSRRPALGAAAEVEQPRASVRRSPSPCATRVRAAGLERRPQHPRWFAEGRQGGIPPPWARHAARRSPELSLRGPVRWFGHAAALAPGFSWFLEVFLAVRGLQQEGERQHPSRPTSWFYLPSESYASNFLENFGPGTWCC